MKTRPNADLIFLELSEPIQSVAREHLAENRELLWHTSLPDPTLPQINCEGKCGCLRIFYTSQIPILQCHSLRRGTFEEPVIIDGSIKSSVWLGKADPNTRWVIETVQCRPTWHCSRLYGVGSVHSASFLPLRDPHAMSAESSSCIACPYKEFQVPRRHIHVLSLSTAYLTYPPIRKRYCDSMFTPLKYYISSRRTM